MKYQVTMICESGAYKPVSAIVTRDKEIDLKNKHLKMEIVNEGIKKICVKRLWRSADIKRLGYTRVKVRAYDEEKIAQNRKDNYDLIKAIKYTTGEWDRPTK